MIDRRIQELIDQGKVLPHGPAKVALFEEAVRLADAAGDGAAGYWARRWVIHAAGRAGREELLPVMLAWNLAYFDAHEGELDAAGMLMNYGFVMWYVPHLADVPRTLVLELFDDFERRMRRHGGSMRLFHVSRRAGMMVLNDHAAAARSHAYLRRHPLLPGETDALSAASEDVGYLVERKRYRAAVARAEPVLATGVRTEFEPQQMLAMLLLAFLKTNRPADAAAAQRRAAALARRHPTLATDVWGHVGAYFVHTGQLAAAKRVIEAHLPHAFNRPSTGERGWWCRLGHLFAEALQLSGRGSVTMLLPEGAPAPDARGRRDAAALSAWFRAESAASAARLDARNGNTEWADELARVPDELRWARRTFWA